MAEGWLRRFAQRDGIDLAAYSAGTEPGGVHPLAIEVMAEAGVDLSGQRSKHLNEFIGKRLDQVVTVCDRARGACPDLSGLLRGGASTGTGRYEIIHHPFDDPDRDDQSPDQLIDIFRTVRDQIRDWAQGFVQPPTQTAPEAAQPQPPEHIEQARGSR